MESVKLFSYKFSLKTFELTIVDLLMAKTSLPNSKALQPLNLEFIISGEIEYMAPPNTAELSLNRELSTKTYSKLKAPP